MSVKHWYDPASQPCRTVKFVIKTLGIDAEIIPTKAMEDTRTEEFKRDINPQGFVPVLEDKGQKIYESATMCRYLLDAYKGDESLFPREDLLARAQVDSWLDYNNTAVRQTGGTAVDEIIANPMFGAEVPSEEQKKKLLDSYFKDLKHIDTSLKNSDFLTGDKLTIADVQIYNEITSTSLFLKLTFDDFPNIKSWIDRIGENEVIKELNEELQERLKDFAEAMK